MNDDYGKRPGQPVEGRYVALVGVLTAGLVALCLGCAWFALGAIEAVAR